MVKFNSVIFGENKDIRKWKREKMKRLNAIILSYPDWEENKELREEVQDIRLLVGSDSPESSKPIIKIHATKFTPEEYVMLRNLGYSVSCIREVLGMSASGFRNYVEDHLGLSPRLKKVDGFYVVSK
ncbi:hypothetical protein M222_0713 [Enterococcus faecalis AZ19]|uniref:hypothetical protein n=1 Tax=Enterococcus faecalis TaxID=1351 RepID=UPI0004595FF4|nr:hypothetical protein [Enterococcus faecalis]KAJ76010.1 hypothetical protein M222_0713 [Enterococcus faecalis AZ19]